MSALSEPREKTSCGIVVSSFVYSGMQLSNKVQCKYALHLIDNTTLMILTDQDVISHQYGVIGKVLWQSIIPQFKDFCLYVLNYACPTSSGCYGGGYQNKQIQAVAKWKRGNKESYWSGLSQAGVVQVYPLILE